MYLWRMVVSNQDVIFKFTEHTEEKEKDNPTRFFTPDQTYSQDEPSIKPVIEATFKLAKALEIDLTQLPVQEDYIFIERGFKGLSFVYQSGMFEAGLERGKIVLQTKNGWTFTKEQFDAMFEFLEVLKESNWFF